MSAIVRSLAAPADSPEWAGWLAEIGFLPGERVRLMRRAPFGGDPLVVRIGDSTFALHRAEAACVAVEPVTVLAWQQPTPDFVTLEVVGVETRTHYSTTLPAVDRP